MLKRCVLLRFGSRILKFPDFKIEANDRVLQLAAAALSLGLS